jgi:ABC-type nitrate/sulfonate/bicarbonate transport system permease component
LTTSPSIAESLEELGKERLILRVPGPLVPIASLATVIGVWWIISLFVSPLVLSSPGAAIGGIASTIRQGILLPALALSLKEMYVGLAIGVSVGILIGAVLGTFERADALLLPYVNILNSIPGVILIPALVIWFGLGEETRLVFIILITVWPMVINVRAGLRNSAKRYRDLGHAFELRRRDVLFKLQFPASVPYLLAGLRVSMGLAVVGMIVGEMDVSFKGLGFLLINYGASLQTSKLIGLVFVATLVGLVQAGIAQALEVRFLPWTKRA